MTFPHDYILAIRKDSEGKLSLVEIRLPLLFPALKQELEGLLIDQESTVEDMQKAFERCIKPCDTSFIYSYYGQIGGSPVSGQSYPEIYEYTDKSDYMEMVDRYLWGMSYQEAVRGLEKDSSTVIWSWLDQGYTQKEIAVSEHLRIRLSTNFCYGLNSYFILSVYYHDVLILPYDYVVEYLNVKRLGLSSFNYNIDKPGIDVWHDAFAKVVDIANLTEKEFVDRWIISRVSSLLNDMSMLMDKPEMSIQYYYDKDRVEMTSLYEDFSKPQRIHNLRSNQELEDWYWLTVSDKLTDTVSMMRHICELIPHVDNLRTLILRAQLFFLRILPSLESKKEEYSVACVKLSDKMGTDENPKMVAILRNNKIKIADKLTSVISCIREDSFNTKN